MQAQVGASILDHHSKTGFGKPFHILQATQLKYYSSVPWALDGIILLSLPYKLSSIVEFDGFGWPEARSNYRVIR
jgi:hypothetical protein